MPKTDSIESQYSQWVYPAPVADLDNHWDNFDPNYQKLHYAYWPDRPYRPHMRILVAGCGSNQAASIAHRNRAAHVVGIDISDASLAHERLLKNKYALHNLVLEKMAIQQAGSLNQKFDLILASGVIHHQADPVTGLASLGDLLAPDGVISLMVYGKYFRTGVYMLQDLFRMIGLGQSPGDVAVVRQTLENLPEHHLVRNYMRNSSDIKYDSGIVDTFLHTTDQAYNVAECLELIEGAGLRFQGWHDNYFYYPNGQVPTEHLLYERLSALSMRELWGAMELHQGGLGRHDLFCCRPERQEASFCLDFDTAKFFELVPELRNTQLVRPNPPAPYAVGIHRPPCPVIGLNEIQIGLLQRIDGKRSIEHCIADFSLISADGDQRRLFARKFFIALWRMGHLLLRF